MASPVFVDITGILIMADFHERLFCFHSEISTV